MLLTISTTHRPADDLGYLLHKHPGRFQSFNLSFGQAHVFYPEVSEERTTAALLLDVDPVGLVRGKNRESGGLLDQYVNDRPFAASSFMSVALAQVFGTAMGGRCPSRTELAATPLPFVVHLPTLPVRGSSELVAQLFEPLGYKVEIARRPLDERFPEWGESPYIAVTLSAEKKLADLLTHLYVLIPVFDGRKHYYIGDDELEKLLAKGAGWLAAHPLKDLIAKRYLTHRASLYREALARLVAEDSPELIDPEAPDAPGEETEVEEVAPGVAGDPETQPGEAEPSERAGRALSLNEERHRAVVAALHASGARSVIDLGCGEGKLIRKLAAERGFERVVGLDVSSRTLEIAKRRLRMHRRSERDAERVTLLHGSLTYRDERMKGFDAAAIVEVIEHFDPPRLSAFERVVFEFAQPRTVVLTTPNRDYNVMWESLPAGEFRHSDHRFEWTRAEFAEWASAVAQRRGYTVEISPIGPVDPQVGSPTQMAVFTLVESNLAEVASNAESRTEKASHAEQAERSPRE
ncbi:MAG TPA: 3' terminal RNA ribose 2'-O-methyltransferase Hen1 [Pirellulales bacterium]